MNTKLISKETVAEGTMLFRFEKPEGFEYKAGQSIDLTLVNPPETDEKGNTRPFSLVSVPFEKELAIATRMRDSAFKRVLKDMRGGEVLEFEGPFGDLTLHENAKRKAVILAGGIGITPFRSIVAQATFQSLPHHITLLYSNRRPEDAAFLAEFQTFAKTNPISALRLFARSSHRQHSNPCRTTLRFCIRTADRRTRHFSQNSKRSQKQIRSRHYAFSLDRRTGNIPIPAAPHYAFVFEPPTGGRGISRRIPNVRKNKSEFHLRAHHDRDGTIFTRSEERRV